MTYQNKYRPNICKPAFTPKKPIRSFRDLEVYQKTLECSVLVAKHIVPDLEAQKFPMLEGITNCSLSIPLYVAEAHSLRFSDLKAANGTIEKAMMGCNKMIVYLEQAMGLYGDKVDNSLIQDLCLRYVAVRGKMLRLEKAWQKYKDEK